MMSVEFPIWMQIILLGITLILWFVVSRDGFIYNQDWSPLWFEILIIVFSAVAMFVWNPVAFVLLMQVSKRRGVMLERRRVAKLSPLEEGDHSAKIESIEEGESEFGNYIKQTVKIGKTEIR